MTNEEILQKEIFLNKTDQVWIDFVGLINLMELAREDERKKILNTLDDVLKHTL